MSVDVIDFLTAINNKDVDKVRQMIDAGADVNAYDGAYSMLHMAVASENEEIVELLLNAGADIDAKSKGANPVAVDELSVNDHLRKRIEATRALLDGIEKKDENAIKEAISQNPFINTRVANGRVANGRVVNGEFTLLHCAVLSGCSADVVQAMLEAGADIDAKSRTEPPQSVEDMTEDDAVKRVLAEHRAKSSGQPDSNNISFDELKSKLDELFSSGVRSLPQIRTVIPRASTDDLKKYFDPSNPEGVGKMMWYVSSVNAWQTQLRTGNGKFETLYNYMAYLNSPLTANKPEGIGPLDGAHMRISNLIGKILDDPQALAGLDEDDKRVLGIIQEHYKNIKPIKMLINQLNSVDSNTLKAISQNPSLLSDYYLFVGAYYLNGDDGKTKKLGEKYSTLGDLFQELENAGNDQAKKKELQGKIAAVLRELSSSEFQGAMTTGETALHKALVSAYPNPERHIINGGIPAGVNIPQGQPGGTPPVLNPVQDGIAMAQAKSEEEKTPWYKQEWIWWVLGIALAGALGFFAFRKGGWLNKEDKKTATVNTNTNDNSNSNSNTNTNDGNTSGGTLDNSSQNITSADLNNMLATGGRISRQSSDRS